MPAPARTDLRVLELIGFALIAALILVVLPLLLDIFRLNLVGKYLTYAFVAVGLVLCWGHTGILSLGQGVFFGLGGYCMAVFLKLEASSVANTKIQSTPGIPDFMDWNQLTELPFFWVPFKSLTFSLIAIVAVPVDHGLHHRRRDVQAAGRRRVFRDHHPGDRGRDDDPDHRPAGLHRRHQRHHRPADAARLGHSHRRRQSTSSISSAASCCSAPCSSRALSSPASSGASWWPCATRKIASASPATTSPTSRSSCSAWPPRSPRSAARCSPCRSGSCRRRSSASCRRSRW